MSGHSKWSTIKRKKGAIDAERSKIFQKLNKEIFVAAKLGDKDPDNNPNLRMAIDKAKAENMPKDRIQAAIDKAHSSSNSENYESVRYEGYAAGGVAVMVDCLTDNRNRTASFVRSTFTKHGGNLGTDGSVSYLFDRVGLIEIPNDYDEDEVMMTSLDAGALDMEKLEESYMITTKPEDFIKVKDALANMGVAEFLTSEVTYVAQNEVEVDDETREKVEKLYELLEDIDDVQSVYCNIKEN